ncbi:peptide chain release factor-like protein [Patescibacteria group bacterium]|nr:peptide chain release factor-like protein [Patescibacteria group bacterium]MBU1124176.1 peptide chain release factor-like protein [Patescibacteria group bacterium]MBU1911135.1 peptide chain release factor-like protein [Patescibacteria group bacterium]
MHFPVEIADHILKLAAKLGIDPADIEEQHTKGGGHGGQKINKSTNCVELTHEPTGITVRYQHHRGLHQNRKEAYELMILKIDEEVRGVESELAQKHHKIEKQKQRRSRRSKEKMLGDKKKRAEIKEMRKRVDL